MSFAIATFNVENLGARPGDAPDSDARLAALRPVLAALAADILCLQEVNAPRPDPLGARTFGSLDRLLEGTPYAHFHRAASTRPGADEPADVHNLVILSRYRLTGIRQLHHDFVPQWDWIPPGEREPVRAIFDRPILSACVQAPGGPVHVLNLHLRAPRAAHLPVEKSAGRWLTSSGWAKGMYLASQLRQAQALEARLFVEAVFDREPDARIIVCGDFNADSFETPTRILCGAPEDGEDEAFLKRRLERLEMRAPVGTRFSIIHGGRKALLDHVLASQNLARLCGSVEILNEGLVDEAHAPQGFPGSLHAPVVARFA
jgi:endonuclease/exonuclease/phosphatase family metal-dependent hydrolase